MSADWTPAENLLIGQNIDETSTTQNHDLGLVVRAKHTTYGVAEFIYLQGVASTVAGSWVIFARDDHSTTLIVPNAVGPVAIAMSACVASNYGWYMISGKHNAALADDVADSGYVYIDTAAGTCDDAVVAGDRVWNAKWASADDTATGTAEVAIQYPQVTNISET